MIRIVALTEELRGAMLVGFLRCYRLTSAGGFWNQVAKSILNRKLKQ
ncbi:MAG: hypothetical protein GF353_03080 [Candidatus Lokiarchaeota archaeon]|nr:hypothetical protein [Candidatus Lokiarchaeota archaeon]